MTTKPSREELIAQIRAAYARPQKAGQARADRLATMDGSALEVLHGKLARLAARADLQGHPTAATSGRRTAAKMRFRAALDELAALRNANSPDARKAKPPGSGHS